MKEELFENGERIIRRSHAVASHQFVVVDLIVIAALHRLVTKEMNVLEAFVLDVSQAVSLQEYESLFVSKSGELPCPTLLGIHRMRSDRQSSRSSCNQRISISILQRAWDECCVPCRTLRIHCAQRC